MTLNALARQGFPFYLDVDRGLSQEARDVRRLQSDTGDIASSYSFELLKTQTINELVKALADASEENWDGYQAASVDLGALSYALNFLSQLPSNFPHPEIAIDNEGEIAFDWDYKPRQIISIRVGRDGSLNYAGLLGYTSFHGVEMLRDSIPGSVLSGIERVVKPQSL